MHGTLEKLEATMREQATQFVESRIGVRQSCSTPALQLPAWPGGAEPGPDPGGREALREKLETALRRERMKARSGSARYDFNRHIALYQAMRAMEREQQAEADAARNSD